MTQEHSSYLNSLKFILASFLFLMTGITATGQISITPNAFDEAYVDVGVPFSFNMESTISNLTQDTLVIGWRRWISEETPASWFFSIGDKNISYPPFEDESPNPIVLPPGATDGYISNTAYLDSPGCGNVVIVLHAFDDPSQVLDSITYSIHVNDPDCSTTSARDISAVPATIVLSPNPAHDILYRPEGLVVDAVHVFNAFGAQLYTLNVSASSWNVSNWPCGIYVLRFMKDARVIGTSRMVKA